MPFTQGEWKKYLASSIEVNYLAFLDEEWEDFDWEIECNAKAGSVKLEKCKKNYNAAVNAVTNLLDRAYYK